MQTKPTIRRSRPERVAASIQDLTMRDIDALASALFTLDRRIAHTLHTSLEREILADNANVRSVLSAVAKAGRDGGAD